MTFDRSARLEVLAADSLPDLLARLGSVGLENGPRTGEGKRSTASNEAYLARRLVLHMAKTGEIGFPISIKHTDSPDFTVAHAAGSFAVEVTEICPAADGHRYATEAEGVGAAIGNYSETGLDQARVDLLAQIEEAISRKAAKPYAGPDVALLLYPNSDASQWVKLFELNARPGLFDQINTEPFFKAFTLWGDEIIVVGKQ